jgi:lycopene cyclase domain-containing protein
VTYAGVLAWFVVPAIAVAAFFARRAIDRRFVVVLVALVLVACVATFPWDSQAVRWGIWRFDDAKTCGVRLGVLPIEECAFFGLQTLLVALLYRALTRRT